MTGMYMDRAAYNIKKVRADWFRELLELIFPAAGLIIDTLRTFFLDSAFHIGSAGLCDFRL